MESTGQVYIKEVDYPKEMIESVKIMLRSLNLPAKKYKWSTLAFLFIITNTIVMQIAHVSYMIMNITDVQTMADTCSTVSTTFQGIFKLTSLYFNSDKILKMFQMITEHFWPTYISDKKLSCSLNNLSKFSESLMIFFYILITFCCCLLLVPPIYMNVRELPLSSYYPFHWEVSPYYEILYVWQWFVNLYGVCYVVGAHDFLFVGLMVSLITQLELLKFVLKAIGNENENYLNDKLLDCSGVEEKYDQREEDRLLIKCVQHHRKLIIYSELLEKSFSTVVFLQFVESASGVCLGIFLLNIVEGVNFLKLVFFIVGHLIQLLLYCVIGNEVMYLSMGVSDAAFDCGWYKKNCPYLRRGLLLLIQHAQRGIKITALKVADLNILSFISVLKISFSFSTLLKNLIEKQKGKNTNSF